MVCVQVDIFIQKFINSIYLRVLLLVKAINLKQPDTNFVEDKGMCFRFAKKR